MATAIYTAARMSLLLTGWVVAYAVSLLLEDVGPTARLFVMTAIGAWWTFICVMIVRREAERATTTPE
jgi:hypothetical protein